MAIWTVIHCYWRHGHIVLPMNAHVWILIALFARVIQQILWNLNAIHFFNWLICIHHNTYMTFFIHEWLSSLKPFFEIRPIDWFFSGCNIGDTPELWFISLDIMNLLALITDLWAVLLIIIVSKVRVLIRPIERFDVVVIHSRRIVRHESLAIWMKIGQRIILFIMFLTQIHFLDFLDRRLLLSDDLSFQLLFMLIAGMHLF